jgi:hypothetical protein
MAFGDRPSPLTSRVQRLLNKRNALHSFRHALNEIDRILSEGEKLLHVAVPAREQSTLFDRMRARVSAQQAPDPYLRERIQSWLDDLRATRRQILDQIQRHETR